MNVALIIAGGSGQRMQQDIPKQFLHIHDKPVIIYTLEGFQRNPQIDAIEVVCLDGWHEVLWANAKQFGIDKLKWVISGGSTAQESIRNGIENLSDVCGAEDILVIHDGIRPMVENFVLDDVIVKCRQYGNGVTSLPYNEQIFVKDDEFTTTSRATPCAECPHRRRTATVSLRMHIERRLQRASASSRPPTPTR